MKKIIILGFPHCGTTILRSIFGKCCNVTEQYYEEYNILNNNYICDTEFYLIKNPFAEKEYFSETYDDFIKVFIIRNPIFVFSSINNRFSNVEIPKDHKIEKFIDTIKLFDNCKNNNYKNTYTIKYEDLFINDFHNLKSILNDIGCKYSNEIFINKVSDNVCGWPKEYIPKTRPDPTDHDRYRVWQLCQPFVSNNDILKLNLTNINKEEILNSKIILKLYPEIEYLLYDDIVIPFGEECYTAQSIDTKFVSSKIRKCSFPFDYVGHTYIENIYKNLVDLLNLNTNNCNLNNFYFKKFENKYFMCHKIYEFKYWHDIYTYDITINKDDEINTFIEKYNRRYERLKYYLKYCKNIKILSVNHFDNIFNQKFKQNTIYELFNLLKSHNKNIKFIAVNFGENLYNIQDLQFVNLPINLNLSFEESKQEFTKNLYDFTKSVF
jgi:hypothetical protein